MTDAKWTVGDLVAAPFKPDNDWYRARVMDVMDDDRIDVYFIDYGDSCYFEAHELLPLK